MLNSRNLHATILAFVTFAAACAWCNAEAPVSGEHPRLYFNADDLPKLRQLRKDGVHAKIWKNVMRSADWCAAQPVRQEWIPTLESDPQYENLYDRFYAAMHDAAIVEHLALTAALADPDNNPYLEPAKKHLLGAARVWKNEAQNPANASKAYAVLRIVKALAVGYDALHHELTPEERREIVSAITPIEADYVKFFETSNNGGAGYNKHHGSVDVGPLGVIALALLGDVPEAQAWTDLAVKKHTDYLLAQGLTPSGTSEYGSLYWASITLYRVQFVDALRRVTGRDLFAEYPDSLPGQIALAAVAAGQSRDLEYNENCRSILFSPNYGQIDFWSPAMTYLARHHRRPIFQHLALWDESLGSLQRTRYVTPTRKEELLFTFGPYAYLWCDPTIAPKIEDNLPHSFVFPEPEVGEAYARSSYAHGDLVLGAKRGSLNIHAGGRIVFADLFRIEQDNVAPKPIANLSLTDDGRRAVIRCTGPDAAGIGAQCITLVRPGELRIERDATKPLTWWYAGDARIDGNTFHWPDGTLVTIARGKIGKVDPHGNPDKLVHFGGMKWADPHPYTYPTVDVEPVDGKIIVEITAAAKPAAGGAQ
jgi:hypothetical protein